MQTATNKLSTQLSPYLLQHATNPVQWYPWSDEAFEKATAEDKPLFVSIGYATCHWCHVMEEESFSDPQVAQLLNQHFINIKVDREERPDIDNIYMQVCLLATGSGGWPLTIVMTPSKKPFFANTYLPKHDRYGRAGLLTILPRLAALWHEQRSRIERSGDRIITALSELSASTAASDLPEEALVRATEQLQAEYDEVYGGFGRAPKFPTPHHLTFLLRRYAHSRDRQQLQMVLHSLRQMHQGGIWDQLGFGFHRYATDRRWRMPHFEKMLYDQALLLIVYSRAYAITADPDLSDTAHGIAEYVQRELTSADGAFFTAQDADSDGEEGAFYLWSRKEAEAILPPRQAELVFSLFDAFPVDQDASRSRGQASDRDVLHRAESLDQAARQLKISTEDAQQLWRKARTTMFERRSERPRPALDDKILCDWNGLMIAALAIAGRLLDCPDYVSRAESAASFVLDNMQEAEGKLLHRYRAGESGIPGMLDDYAFFGWGLIELYRSSHDLRWLERAHELTQRQLELFWDEVGGGFFLSSKKTGDLVIRQKGFSDASIPSGNAISLANLVMLSAMTGEARFLDHAHELVRAAAHDIQRAPAGHSALLTAFADLHKPPSHVVIVGQPDDERTEIMLDALRHEPQFDCPVVLKTEQNAKALAELAPYTSFMKQQNGHATAYVCQQHACHHPTTDATQMLRLLSRGSAD